jgi:hypothetical protein
MNIIRQLAVIAASNGHELEIEFLLSLNELNAN